MGFVPVQTPAGVVQSGESPLRPPRPPRPPRLPSCRLESIPELRQIELGSSSQQDGPLPGIGFVTATMGQGPPPPGFVPADLAEEMAARARKVLRLTPIREKIDPNSPTTKLTDFCKEDGGAARLVNLEVIIRPPGKGPPFLEAAEHAALEALEAAAEAAAGSSSSSGSSTQPSPDGPASTGGKRRRVVSTQFTRERRAKATTMVEEELRDQLEQHRWQLANALSWLNHAVAERDHYAREKMRLYEILERDKALYQEAIDTAPSTSPPSSPTFLNAALYAASSAAPAAASASASASPCRPAPAPPLPVLYRKGKGVMRSLPAVDKGKGVTRSSPPPTDGAWKEWTRNSPPSWANASSPPRRPAPPPPVPAPPRKHHRRALPSAPGSSSSSSSPSSLPVVATAMPGSPPYPPPPPRAPRLGSSAPKVHYSTHASSSSSSSSASYGGREEHRLRQHTLASSSSASRPSPLRHEVSMHQDDEEEQQSVELAPVQEQQQGATASSSSSPSSSAAWGTVQTDPKLAPMLPSFDGPWGNACLRSITPAPDLRPLNAPFL